MSDIEKSKLLVELTAMVSALNKRLEEDAARAEEREKTMAAKAVSNEKALAEMSAKLTELLRKLSEKDKTIAKLEALVATLQKQNAELSAMKRVADKIRFGSKSQKLKKSSADNDDNDHTQPIIS